MKKTFNLNSFRKKAYYEDAKGLMQGQSRSWMNCYKSKVAGGMAAQKAIESCMAEYQKTNSMDWSLKHASTSDKKEKGN